MQSPEMQTSEACCQSSEQAEKECYGHENEGRQKMFEQVRQQLVVILQPVLQCILAINTRISVHVAHMLSQQRLCKARLERTAASAAHLLYAFKRGVAVAEGAQGVGHAIRA